MFETLKKEPNRLGATLAAEAAARFREGAPVLARLYYCKRSVATFLPQYGSALRSPGELTPTWLARILGEAAMTGVLNDLLLFSCLAAFVTGVVIAAATILI